jgi:ketosteroid isomerase-like protein
METPASTPTENVQKLRRIYREWGRGQFQAGSELFDPWVVLVLRPEFPDVGAYLGPDEIRRYMRGFLEDWTEAAIEAEEFLEAGDSVVVAVHQRASGKGSGIPVDMRYFQVWTFRGGAVIRIENIRDRPDALRTAGLTE